MRKELLTTDVTQKDSPSLQTSPSPRAGRRVQVTQKQSLQMCPRYSHQSPWGLVKPAAPRPFWNQKLLLLCSPRDSDGHSHLRTTIWILSDGNSSVTFTTWCPAFIAYSQRWGAYSPLAQPFPTLGGSVHGKALPRSELKCDLCSFVMVAPAPSSGPCRPQMLLPPEGPLETGRWKGEQT